MLLHTWLSFLYFHFKVWRMFAWSSRAFWRWFQPFRGWNGRYWVLELWRPLTAPKSSCFWTRGWKRWHHNSGVVSTPCPSQLSWTIITLHRTRGFKHLLRGLSSRKLSDDGQHFLKTFGLRTCQWRGTCSVQHFGTWTCCWRGIVSRNLLVHELPANLALSCGLGTCYWCGIVHETY